MKSISLCLAGDEGYRYARIGAGARSKLLCSGLMNEPPVGFRVLSNAKKKDLIDEVFFLWLGRRFLKITFSQQEDDPIVDVDEIRELLDEEVKEGGDE